MTLTLAPGFDRRERILAFGSTGTGKSYAWQTILAHTAPDVEFWVIDTDGAWEPAAASEDFAPHAHRVHHFEPLDWRDYLDAINKIQASMSRHDWYVVDLADKAWDEAQNFYAERKYGGENALDVMIEGDEDPMEKWGVINKLYAPFARSLIKCPGNLFVCATEKELKKDNRGNYFRESRQNIRDYGSQGARPGGQKSLGHDVNTILHFAISGGGRQFTLIKDRNREARWGDQRQRTNSTFARDFLLPIAGWRPLSTPQPPAETAETAAVAE